MRAGRRWLIPVAGLLWLGPSAVPAAGQSALALNCQPDNVWDLATDTVPDAWQEHHPRAVTEQALAEVAAAGEGLRWAAGALAVRSSFEEMVRLGGLDAAVRDRIRSELDAAQRDLAAGGGTTGGVANSTRFDPVLDRIDGREEVVFPRFTAGELAVAATEPLATIRAVCWTAVAANELLAFANGNARQATLDGLRDIVAAWDAFNETGYAQYPWELWLNRPAGLRPPRWQVILAHPGVGIELTGIADGIEETRRSDVVLMELAGLIRYNGRRSFYVGASALASLPGDASPGGGLLVHMGPFLKAGYVWRAEAEGEPDRDGILVTADLLQLFADAPGLYRRAREQVADLLAVGGS